MKPEPAVEDAVQFAPDGPTRIDAAYADSLARFAGGIAHDFNNLLTVVNGYSEFILSGRGDPASYTEYVREIQQAGRKAAEIVRMILLYSGHSPQAVETFDLNSALENFRDPLRLSLGDGIALNLDLCPEPPLLRAERGRILWAFLQMAANARESMPDGGNFGISVRCLPRGAPGCCRLAADAPRVLISVRDNGKGMSRDVLSHVFEPYFTTKKSAGAPGLGLGLACVSGIMRQIGGCIRAESQIGNGAEFHICLPMAGRT